jgi:hypothetical protein
MGLFGENYKKRLMSQPLLIIQLKKVIDEENKNTKYRRSGECL